MSAGAVSIVLPVFNRLEYLRQAVASVFSQTHTNWHLYIADDGSDGETQAYLREVALRAGTSILWLDHSGNPAAVRNAALREARGDYIAFLDSDDMWAADKLARQIASLRSSNGLGWGYTGYTRINARGIPTLYPGTRQWVPYRGDIVVPLLSLEAEVSTPAVIVERALMEQVGRFDETLALFEDYDMWLRLAHLSNIDLIDEPLTLLRSHEEHYSGGTERVPLNRIRQLDQAESRATSGQQRRVIGRQRVRSQLQLASLPAASSRRAALDTLRTAHRQSWRQLRWWTGLPKILLKIATPPRLLALSRILRQRRRPFGLNS